MKNVILQAGKWRAEILPSFGCDLTGLWYGEAPVLRPAQPHSLLKTDSPFLYGSPLLFPPNRTDGGRFVFDGKTYLLPVNEPERNNHLHGLLYDAPFRTLRQSGQELLCQYHSRGRRYPFPFSLTMHWQMTEKGLQLSAALRNDGGRDMPAVLGFHTTFAAPPSFSVPIGLRWERDERLLPTGKLLPLTPGEEQIRKGCSAQGWPLSGYYTAAGHAARIGAYEMRTSPEFTQWVLFNGGGTDGFVCVEPQTGCVNGLNRMGGCRVLPAHAEETYRLFWGLAGTDNA